MQEKRTPKDLLDVITFYPARGQAAIYLTLDYVDQGLGKVMPYNGFLPYEDDYYRMVEHICSGSSNEILSRILSLMMDDLRILVEPLKKSFTKTGKVRKNSKYSPEYLMSYGVMMDAINRILQKFRTMTENDMNRLLESRKMEGRILYFEEIEKLSDGIIVDLMGEMMKSMKMDSPFNLNINKWIYLKAKKQLYK